MFGQNVYEARCRQAAAHVDYPADLQAAFVSAMVWEPASQIRINRPDARLQGRATARIVAVGRWRGRPCNSAGR